MGTTDQVRTSAGYDRVSSRSADGTETTWTRTQFEGLGLVDRVRLLAGGELRFFLEGVEVSARSALSRD